MPGCCRGITCNCLINAGAGITVTGAGLATDPFVISSSMDLSLYDTVVDRQIAIDEAVNAMRVYADNIITTALPGILPGAVADELALQVPDAVADELALQAGSTAWAPLDLQSTWVDVGGVWPVARYRKIMGIVFIQGRVEDGADGDNVFLLPAGFRPGVYLHISVSAGNTSVGRLEISPSGGAVLDASDYDCANGISLTCSFPADA